MIRLGIGRGALERERWVGRPVEGCWFFNLLFIFFFSLFFVGSWVSCVLAFLA